MDDFEKYYFNLYEENGLSDYRAFMSCVEAMQTGMSDPKKFWYMNFKKFKEKLKRADMNIVEFIILTVCGSYFIIRFIISLIWKI